MKKQVIIDVLCGFILFTLIMIVLLINFKSIPFSGKYERVTEYETEKLVLGKNRHFSYYTSEGNAVGDYDLCDSFKYNSRNSTINLKCTGKLSGSLPTKIKVIFFDDKKIILSFNGEERTFLKVKD